MKFSITTFFFTLLSIAPGAVAFTTSAANNASNNLKLGGRLSTFGRSSVLASTATANIDDSAAAAADDIDNNIMQDGKNADDVATLMRKEALGFSEDDLRQSYSDWVVQYKKEADESRYVTFKKNFLLQEEYNKNFGVSYTLNEYGDMTEEEFYAMQSQAVVIAPPKEEKEAVKEIPDVENNHDDNSEEEVEEIDAVGNDEEEESTIATMDEATDDSICVEKYTSIENVEERAFEVLKDLNFVKPAPQHFSFSYVDETPELRLENGATYMDALHNPKVSALERSTYTMMMTSSSSAYLSSMPTSESGTFEKGKKQSGKNALGAATAYLSQLDEICDVLEPFMDCDKPSSATREQRTPIQITSPIEDSIYKRTAQIKALGDKAFQVLVELCSLGRCERK